MPDAHIVPAGRTDLGPTRAAVEYRPDGTATQVAVVVINTGSQTTLPLSIDSGSFGTLTFVGPVSP